METPKKILIIDPIFRGSRLFYTWILATGAYQRGYQVDIMTRSHAKNDHYLELFQKIDHKLYEHIQLPENFWYGKIPNEQIQTTVNFLIKYKLMNYSLFFFTGLNEYLPNILIKFDHYFNELNNLNIRMVDYDSSYLLKKGKINFISNRYLYMKLLFIVNLFFKKKIASKYHMIKNALKKYPKLKIFLLDERAFDNKISNISDLEKNRLIFLPDPGPQIQVSPKNIKKDYIFILIVGLQSKRKGIYEIFNLLMEHGHHFNKVKFLLAGRFDQETKLLKNNISKLKNILEYHEGFFSEKKIQSFYQNTDYVILPYEKSFNGSSGVMAYSTTFGKPVITTNHGCIGYRTKAFEIGFVYESGHIDQLREILHKLPSVESSEYQNLSNNCKKFAAARTIETHQNIIFNTL